MLSGYPGESSTSSSIQEEEDASGKKSVTVTIDECGNINVDQEVLKSILDSNQESATVTFVRIGEEEPPPLPEESPGGDIILDTEEMTRLEKVLRSAEAKDFLSTVLAQTPTLIQDQEEVLVDVVDVVDVVDPSSLHEQVLIPPEGHIILAEEAFALIDDSDSSKKEEELKMTRRSQRQMDKEMKEEAQRIRLENQVLMRKELEETPPTPPLPSLPSLSSLPPAPLPMQGRPKRERKVPAHLLTGDYESSLLPTLLSRSAPSPAKAKRNVSAGKVGPPSQDNEVEDDGEEEEEDSGDWNSEDDPERLWCICNQPHNNRFMICCDSCLDWFHGKCVGITKKMGKEMEEASRVWKCPKCVQELNALPSAPEEALLVPPKSLTNNTPTKKGGTKAKKIVILEPDKKKERSCFVCDKPPRMNSIFCSDDCISKHAMKAKALLQKSRPKASDVSASTGKSQVLVIEPNTNTMLNGPNAPTEGTLEDWLKSHPTYHVVMPTSLPTSKFYGNSSIKKASSKVTIPSAHGSNSNSSSGIKNIHISPDGSKVILKKSSPTQGATSSEELREADIKKVQKSLQQHIQKEYKKSTKVVSSSSSCGSAIKNRNKQELSFHHRSKSPPSRRATSPQLSAPAVPPGPAVDPKPIRANAVKGFYDALKARLSKVTDVQISDDDLNCLVGEIEESLFRYYNKDVSSKYKAKYRSLVFNIKDEKNTGFFRKIVSRKISSGELVSLTPEDMANKELQRWREKELKNDIEKIKSHELDMIQLGSKFVMKSHKGEIAIEGEGASTASSANPPLKLPEEINDPELIQSSRKKDWIEGAKTWDHGTHDFEPTCDVCNGKKTLEEFLTIKIAKEQKEAKAKVEKQSSKSSKSKEGERKSSSHHIKSRRRSISKDKDSKRSSSKDRDSKRSSSKDGDSKKSSSKDRDSKRSSSKDKHSSSKSRDSKRTKEGDSSKEKDFKVLRCKDGDSKRSSKDGDSKRLSKDGDSKRSSKDGDSKLSLSKEKDSGIISTKEGVYKETPPVDKDSKEKSPNVKDESLKEASGKSSPRHSRRDEKKDSSKSSSRSSSHKFKSSQEKRLKDSINKTSSHSSSRDNVSKKSLEEIWSSKRKDVQESSPENKLSTPPDSSETNKKIEEAQKTIESVIKSSIPEINYTKTSETNNEVVSSTVTIKTPESVSTETNPIVWKGDLNMPDVAKFSVTAHQVSGTTDYLTVDLKPVLKIVGRIDPSSVWEYIAKMKESPNKEVLLVRLEPTTEDEKALYLSFFNYLQNRNRFGVVGESTGKTVKDCYILPLGATQTVHSCMLPFEGPGLEFLKSDMLLALIVRGKRKRSHDYHRSSQSYGQPKNQKVQILEESENAGRTSSSRKRDLEMPRYDPLLPIKSSKEEDDAYDPEIAFMDDKTKKPDKCNPDSFSDEEDSVVNCFRQQQQQQQTPPLTSSGGGGFTEKLAKLTAEIEMQKKEIDSIESSMSHKTQELSRDPRHKSPGPSRLRSMTDEDLMAKAQEMLELQSACENRDITQNEGKEEPPMEHYPSLPPNPSFPPPGFNPGGSNSANVWSGGNPWNTNQSNNKPWNSMAFPQGPWDYNNGRGNPSPWVDGGDRNNRGWHRHGRNSPPRKFNQDFNGYHPRR